ncbi:MAG: nitroreductase [Chloroflexota bacterium]|nr:nitroreductase [Chloroflexota bacterium]
MEIVESITTRKSIRVYKPDPVPKGILHEIIEISVRAPSFENSQPWEFIIVGGEVMAEVKRSLVQKVVAREPGAAHLPIAQLPDKFWDRARENTGRLFELLGIPRDDKEKRNQWLQYQVKSFDAPNAIFVCIERDLSSWALVDVGVIIQTIMMAAINYGLGTCVQATTVMYPEVLKEMFKIPETKLIVCGIAIGYPDMNAPANQFESKRVPLESVVEWHGFEKV